MGNDIINVFKSKYPWEFIKADMCSENNYEGYVWCFLPVQVRRDTKTISCVLLGSY